MLLICISKLILAFLEKFKCDGIWYFLYCTASVHFVETLIIQSGLETSNPHLQMKGFMFVVNMGNVIQIVDYIKKKSYEIQFKYFL